MSDSDGEAGPVQVLDEEDDSNREPTEEEVLEYAEFLGLDPVKEKHLLWIAREGVVAPVPHPWKACQEDDEVFYFNFETSESLWDHPCDSHYRGLLEKHRKEPGSSPEDGSKPTAEAADFDKASASEGSDKKADDSDKSSNSGGSDKAAANDFDEAEASEGSEKGANGRAGSLATASSSGSLAKPSAPMVGLGGAAVLPAAEVVPLVTSPLGEAAEAGVGSGRAANRSGLEAQDSKSFVSEAVDSDSEVEAEPVRARSPKGAFRGDVADASFVSEVAASSDEGDADKASPSSRQSPKVSPKSSQIPSAARGDVADASASSFVSEVAASSEEGDADKASPSSRQSPKVSPKSSQIPGASRGDVADASFVSEVVASSDEGDADKDGLMKSVISSWRERVQASPSSRQSPKVSPKSSQIPGASRGDVADASFVSEVAASSDEGDADKASPSSRQSPKVSPKSSQIPGASRGDVADASASSFESEVAASSDEGDADKASPSSRQSPKVSPKSSQIPGASRGDVADASFVSEVAASSDEGEADKASPSSRQSPKVSPKSSQIPGARKSASGAGDEDAQEVSKSFVSEAVSSDEEEPSDHPASPAKQSAAGGDAAASGASSPWSNPGSPVADAAAGIGSQGALAETAAHQEVPTLAQRSRPPAVLDHIACVHSARSSNPSEVSEDFRSDWGALSPPPSARSSKSPPGGGATGTHSLEVSASCDTDFAPKSLVSVPGASFSAFPAVPEREQLDCEDEEDAAASPPKEKSWSALKADVQALAEVLSALRGLRTQQAEYLRRLKTGA